MSIQFRGFAKKEHFLGMLIQIFHCGYYLNHILIDST